MTDSTVPAVSVGLNPDELPLQVVLTCRECTHRYQPGPEGYRSGRTACPQCHGYVFTAELCDPAVTVGSCAHDWRADLDPVGGAPIRACDRCERIEPVPAGGAS